MLLNLELVTKIEEFDEFVRLYLTSGDIEEVDKGTFISALTTSNSGYFTYEQKPTTGFDGLDNDDIEDVTNLSDGNLVPDSALNDAKPNAVVEGADVIWEDDDGSEITPEEVAHVVRLLKTQGIRLS